MWFFFLLICLFCSLKKVFVHHYGICTSLSRWICFDHARLLTVGLIFCWFNNFAVFCIFFLNSTIYKYYFITIVTTWAQIYSTRVWNSIWYEELTFSLRITKTNKCTRNQSAVIFVCCRDGIIRNEWMVMVMFFKKKANAQQKKRRE